MKEQRSETPLPTCTCSTCFAEDSCPRHGPLLEERRARDVGHAPIVPLVLNPVDRERARAFIRGPYWDDADRLGMLLTIARDEGLRGEELGPNAARPRRPTDQDVGSYVMQLEQALAREKQLRREEAEQRRESPTADDDWRRVATNRRHEIERLRGKLEEAVDVIEHIRIVMNHAALKDRDQLSASIMGVLDDTTLGTIGGPSADCAGPTQLDSVQPLPSSAHSSSPLPDAVSESEVQEALAQVNDLLGIGAGITHRGDEVKCMTWDDGEAYKTYFAADECEELANAFHVLSVRLRMAKATAPKGERT